MLEAVEVRNARDMAIGALVVAASKANKSMGTFSGWLIAGVGFAFTLLLLVLVEAAITIAAAATLVAGLKML